MVDFKIEQIVPHFLLADRTGYALAKAIEKALNILCDTVKEGTDLLSDVETMPEWRLDEMAWEYGMDWYDYTADIDEKRRSVGDVMSFYHIMGTPYAVNKALSDVFGDGFIEEWFNYSGEPYHFTAYTSDSQATTTKFQKFIKLLNVIKPVRSTLDNIIITGAEGEAKAYTDSGIVGISTVTSSKTV